MSFRGTQILIKEFHGSPVGLHIAIAGPWIRPPAGCVQQSKKKKSKSKKPPQFIAPFNCEMPFEGFQQGRELTSDLCF